MYKKFFGVYSQVVLGAEMKMVDVKSSKVIWQAEHTEKTHSDAIPVSPFSIPEAVVDSSMNVREKVITDTADRLVKNLLSVFQVKILVLQSTPVSFLLNPLTPQWEFIIGYRTVIHYKAFL